jgi:hypothetical protein
MIKLHDTMDKTTKNKEEKDPGFNRLEDHRKKLMLNASAIPRFEVEASSPTEFYLSFLAKKSQFKAKDMLIHRFHLNKIAFNPNPTFVTNLWKCKFFWLLPDSPSGVSIFYCQETKSTNANELEKERCLALADKIKPTDIEKLSKQKMHLPTSIMDLVWMTQNFNAVVSLCFGPNSHSSMFLKDRTNHIYDNRLIYSSIYASDPFLLIDTNSSTKKSYDTLSHQFKGELQTEPSQPVSQHQVTRNHCSSSTTTTSTMRVVTYPPFSIPNKTTKGT